MRRNEKKNSRTMTVITVAAAVAALGLLLLTTGCGRGDVNGNGASTQSTEHDIQENSNERESGTIQNSGENETWESSEEEYEFVNVNESVFATMNANLHELPDETSKVISVVLKDTYMVRTGYDGEWCRILYEGSTYYIQTRYLRLPREGEEIPSESESQSPEPTQAPEAAPSPTPAPSATPVPDPSIPVEGALTRDQIAALDNTTIGWGYSTTDRDEYNRPNGCLYYERLYGKYGAEFIKENTNQIYLTFDEGYEAGYTGQILDILKEKNATGVFFVTLQYCKQNPDLVRRMIDEGHVVGNHSCSHPSGGLPQYGMEYTENDIMELHQYVLDNFGYEMTLMRYPEGAFSEQSLALMQSLGYRCIFWSFAHKDWVVDDQPPVTETYNRVTSQMHNGAIYLLHAVSSSNTAALGDIIDYARANGYEIGHYE